MTILLALLVSVAFAKDFPVSDQDQQAIQSICDVAATSPNLPRDARANVASWCVQWEHRVQAANKPEVKPADPDK
jgi:hypothetical protein